MMPMDNIAQKTFCVKGGLQNGSFSKNIGQILTNKRGEEALTYFGLFFSVKAWYTFG